VNSRSVCPRPKKPTGPAVSGQEAAEQPKRKTRILIVDENADTAQGMGKVMKLIGHEVATVHDGNEAMETGRVNPIPLRLRLFCTPEPDGPIVTGGSQRCSVGRERHDVDALCMAVEHQENLAGDRVPEAHHRVATAGRERAAVGRKGEAQDGCAQSLERSLL
jgi:hypothetical protein